MENPFYYKNNKNEKGTNPSERRLPRLVPFSVRNT